MGFKEQQEQGTSPKGRTERERRNEQVRGGDSRGLSQKGHFCYLDCRV